MTTLNRSIRIVESLETRRRNRIFFSIFLAIFLFLIFYTAYRFGIREIGSRQVQTQLALMRIQTLEKSMAEDRQNILRFQKTVLNELHQQRDGLTGQLEKFQAEINRFKLEKNELEKKIGGLRAEIGEYKVTNEELRRVENELVILNAQIDYINRFNKNVINSLSASQEEIEKVKSRI